MIRVCGVFGTWQLMTLAAALRQANLEQGVAEESRDDVLVVYETAGVTPEFKEALDRMARAAWPWRRIVWAYDLLKNQAKLSEREFTALMSDLHERAGVRAEEVEEVWVCYLTRPAERLLFEAFPSARLVLYEDGLITYIPIRAAGEPSPRAPTLRKRVVHWLRLRGRARTPWQRFRYGGGGLHPAHLARASATYLQLTGTEPLPEALATIPRHDVPYEILRSVLTRVAGAFEFELAAERAMTGEVLVLGQALSRNGVMPRETELALYRGVVETVLTRGYRVLWKEHPRVSEPFFAAIQAHAEAMGKDDRLRRLRLSHVYPIELVAPRLRLVGCVAGSSAAPFYLSRLYGMACYTFSDDLLPYMHGVDVFMNRMVRREAAPLSELAPLHPATDANEE